MEQNKFSGLLDDQQLIEGLSKLNITKPTPVQELSIPLALQGKDIIVQAQTGSGKTLAFMLPIISRIRTQKIRNQTTSAIVICPTRELAVQVKAVVESLDSDITPSCIIGGTSFGSQEKQLNKDARIIVGTPGRLLDLIRQRMVDLRKCETFVLDEADEMLSMGFVDEVREILLKLPHKRHGMFFSATISHRVSALASGFLKNPESVVVAINKQNEPKIEHYFCRVDAGLTSKPDAICKIFTGAPGKSAIVFCNTKSDTELVEVFLKRRGFNAAKINSDLSQKERDRVLNDLKTGAINYLIATDVAARGIDIKELEMVINYSLPKEQEVYVHRTGRTGRAGASGKAISIIAPQDFGSFHQLNRDRTEPIKEINLAVPIAEILAA